MVLILVRQLPDILLCCRPSCFNELFHDAPTRADVLRSDWAAGVSARVRVSGVRGGGGKRQSKQYYNLLKWNYVPAAVEADAQDPLSLLSLHGHTSLAYVHVWIVCCQQC